MITLVPRWQYHEQTAATRAERLRPWHEARFGMFIHLGPYSVVGRHEWLPLIECWPHDEYRALADRYQPAPGAPREWARLAKRAGMKYMVFTARHGEGYCNWDTETTAFNSVQTGPKRDLVAEYVEACRAEGLLVGIYFCQTDNLHPDAGAAPYDPAARQRYNDYNRRQVRELMSRYGRIDILWFDGGCMLKNPEGWESDAMVQMVRALQPHIVINNRSKLPEDYETPEGEVTRKGKVIYFWRHTWAGTEQGLGGYETKLERVTCLTTGKPIRFDQDGYRILLRDLPEQCPEPETQVVVFKLEFEAEPVFKWLPTTPAVVANW